MVYLKVSKDAFPGKDLPPGDRVVVQMLCELELATRRMKLAKMPLTAAIDVDAKVGYRALCNRVEERDFDGHVKRVWPVRGIPDECNLASDRKCLVLGHAGRLSRSRQFTVLDLTTGKQTLPVPGEFATAGKNGAVYFLHQQQRENLLETSLYRIQRGEESPTQLFFVSTVVADRPSFLGTGEVRLSADGSWLAWFLPVEHSESGTLLLDLENQEYQILGGQWVGYNISVRKGPAFQARKTDNLWGEEKKGKASIGRGRKGVRENAGLNRHFRAVGTALAGHPPHGSVREELPHTALTLGSDDRRPRITARSLVRPTNRCLAFPALSPARVRFEWRFPWSIPFPPRTPPPPSGRLCSPASSVSGRRGRARR